MEAAIDRTGTTSSTLVTIASSDRYEDAQRVVDRLSDSDFPVQHLTIIGSGLKVVERVTGRLDAGKATVLGALSFMPIAGLFGLIFGVLFAPTGVTMLATVAYWLVVGVVVGAAFGLIRYLLSRGQRDFTSVMGVQPERWDVMAEASVADEARRLLGLTSDATRDRPTG